MIVAGTTPEGLRLSCNSCGRVVQLSRRFPHGFGCKDAKGIAGLTRREKQVCFLIAGKETLSVKECATRLGVEVNTVEAHKYNIFRHLGIHKLSQLVRLVMEYESGAKEPEGPPAADFDDEPTAPSDGDNEGC